MNSNYFLKLSLIFNVDYLVVHLIIKYSLKPILLLSLIRTAVVILKVNLIFTCT